MANLVAKSKTKIALILITVLFVLSLLSIFFFRLNLGVEFKDASVIIVQLDHEESILNVENKVSKYVNLSKIEKEGTSKFYLYLQNYSGEQIIDLKNNIKTNIDGVITTDNYDYYTAREKSLLIRTEIISGFALFVYGVYFVFNLKNKKILRKDVLSLFITDIAVIGICTTILIGFVSLLGEMGVIMNINFVCLVLFSFGVIMIFRLYDLQKFKAVIKTNEYIGLNETNGKLISYYWPEYIFISSFLLLISYIPLTVINPSLLKAGTMIVFSIFISLLGVFYLKPKISELFLSLFEIKQLKKIRFFSKQW